MINENMYRPETSINEDEKAAKDFSDFVNENKFTADQVRAAYHQFCGIEEGAEGDANVKKIFEKMNELADNGFPLNRMAELIGNKQSHEDAVPRYYQFIESLNFSAKEKKVLRSIVERRRAGKMEFFVDGKLIVEFRIRKLDIPAESLAEEMMDIIQKIIEQLPGGKKVDFMFAED